jgi:hypothetical protein
VGFPFPEGIPAIELSGGFFTIDSTGKKGDRQVMGRAVSVSLFPLGGSPSFLGEWLTNESKNQFKNVIQDVVALHVLPGRGAHLTKLLW